MNEKTKNLKITFEDEPEFLRALELLGKGTLAEPNGFRLKTEVLFEEKIIEFRNENDHKNFAAVLKKNDPDL